MKLIRMILASALALLMPAAALAQGTVVYTNNPVIQKGMKFQGAYVPSGSGSTYSINDVVTFGGQSYVSVANNNSGHTPSSSPSWWNVLATGGGGGGLPTTTKVLQGDGAGNASASSFFNTSGASGTVTTSGTTITYASGTSFDPTGGYVGVIMTINGAPFVISSCPSTTSCTSLTTLPTYGSPVAYSIPSISGTQKALQAPVVNSMYNPTSYLSGSGGNGIANALTAGGRTIVVPANYPGGENAETVAMPDKSSIHDYRGGANYLARYWNAAANTIPSTLECSSNGLPDDPNYLFEGHTCEQHTVTDWYPGYDLGNPAIPGMQLSYWVKGHVTISGSTATWIDGDQFTTNCGSVLSCWNGLTMTLTIGGQNLSIPVSSCSSLTVCTLSSSPGNGTYPYQLGANAGWSGGANLNLTTQSYNQGIHQQLNLQGAFWGSGDLQVINISTITKCASIAASDQGCYDIYFNSTSGEAPMWTGTVTTGSTGATTLVVNNNSAIGPRVPLIDTTTKITGCTGTLVSTSGGIATVNLTGSGCASGAPSLTGTIPVELNISQNPDNRTNTGQARTLTITCTLHCGTGLTTSSVLYFGQGIFFESVKPTAVGAFSGSDSGGTQQITATFRFSHRASEKFCVGGYAGWFYDQTNYKGGSTHYLHNILCSVTTSQVLVGYMAPNQITNSVVTGPVDLYQGSNVTYVADDGVTVGVEDNNVPYAAGHALWNSSAPSEAWGLFVDYAIVHDPYAGTVAIDQEVSGNGWLGVSFSKYQNIFGYNPDDQSYQNVSGGRYYTPVFAGIGVNGPGFGPYGAVFDIGYDPVGFSSNPVGFLLRTFTEFPGATEHCFNIWEEGDQSSSIGYCHDTANLTLQAQGTLNLSAAGGIINAGQRFNANAGLYVTPGGSINGIDVRGGSSTHVSVSAYGSAGYGGYFETGTDNGDGTNYHGVTRIRGNTGDGIIWPTYLNAMDLSVVGSPAGGCSGCVVPFMHAIADSGVMAITLGSGVDCPQLLCVGSHMNVHADGTMWKDTTAVCYTSTCPSGTGTGGTIALWSGSGSTTTLGNSPLDYNLSWTNMIYSSAPLMVSVIGAGSTPGGGSTSGCLTLTGQTETTPGGSDVLIKMCGYDLGGGIGGGILYRTTNGYPIWQDSPDFGHGGGWCFGCTPGSSVPLGINVAVGDIYDGTLVSAPFVATDSSGKLISTSAPSGHVELNWHLQLTFGIGGGISYPSNSILSSIYYVPATATSASYHIAADLPDGTCTTWPQVTVLDLGTSATTAYGSATVISTVSPSAAGATTATGTYTFTSGHYIGFGLVNGDTFSCSAIPNVDLTLAY